MTNHSPPLTAPFGPTQVAAVAAVAEKAGVDKTAVLTFAKISAPENKAVFSARSAVKAFAHVKAS